MSLDVYLLGEPREELERWAIFIREDGRQREISRDEWDSRFPDREPAMAKVGGTTRVIYSRNITHNLAAMAFAAGIYNAVWRPDENGIARADQLIELLKAGLVSLRTDPDYFKQLNPDNGYGSYEALVAFAEDYLAACIANPDAEVEVSR